MRSTHFCNTDNGNFYLFSPEKSYFSPIHPTFFNILEKEFDVKQKKLNETNSKKDYQLDDENYYYEKLKYLTKYGFFNKRNIKVDKILHNSDIEKALANLKQLTFEVTEKCNLKCTYCVYSNLYNNSNNRYTNNLNFDIVKNILDFLLPYWNSNLNNNKNGVIYISFYGGEPLLNMKLIKKTVTYIKNLKLNNARFSLTTNGVLLNK